MEVGESLVANLYTSFDIENLNVWERKEICGGLSGLLCGKCKLEGYVVLATSWLLMCYFSAGSSIWSWPALSCDVLSELSLLNGKRLGLLYEGYTLLSKVAWSVAHEPVNCLVFPILVEFGSATSGRLGRPPYNNTGKKNCILSVVALILLNARGDVNI